MEIKNYFYNTYDMCVILSCPCEKVTVKFNFYKQRLNR